MCLMKTLKLSDRRLGIFFLHCGEESFSSLSFLRVPPLFSVFGSSTFSSPQFCISIKHTRGSSPQLSSSRTQSETRTVCLFCIDLQPDRSNSVCGSFLQLKPECHFSLVVTAEQHKPSAVTVIFSCSLFYHSGNFHCF